jgi:hypothetical protein
VRLAGVSRSATAGGYNKIRRGATQSSQAVERVNW